MRFFYQVGLLLWKNFILKIRSPFVVLFELCIPLALFFILLWIRHLNQPVHYWAETFSAMPLPSAGVLSILQLFCNNHAYDTDPYYGFKNYRNSRTSEFLSQFKSISENNNFFMPGFASKEMESLPRIYKTIIDNPASIRDHLLLAKDFELSAIMRNQSEFVTVVTNSTHMTAEQARAILHSKVNIHEIYQLMFGVHHNGSVLHDRRRVRRSLYISEEFITRMKNYGLQSLKKIVLGHLDEIGDALLLKVLSERTLMNNTVAEKVITQLLGIVQFDSVEPWQVADVLKSVLLSPVVLHGLVCLDTGIPIVLTPQPPYTNQQLRDAQAAFCNVSLAQLNKSPDVIYNLTDDHSITKVLLLDQFNLTALTGKITAFRKDVGTFYRFQSSLIELSNFTKSLPMDSCPPPPLSDNITESMNATDTDDSDESTTAPPVTHKKAKKPNKFAGFLKIWYAMQKTICGSDVKIPKKQLDKIHNQDDLKGLDLGELGMSETMEQNLGILLHLLYHNPRILYAPNTTAANTIIQKANASLAMVDEISDYAQHWLNISANIRSYLESNHTANNLQLIQQVHKNIQSHPYLAALLHFHEDTREFLKSPVPDINFFIDQLDTIDNAACSWRNLISGISLDIFKGFVSEDELVNYVLYKASSDDVSIIGSVVFENVDTPNGTLPPHIRYKIRQNASFTMAWCAWTLVYPSS